VIIPFSLNNAKPSRHGYVNFLRSFLFQSNTYRRLSGSHHQSVSNILIVGLSSGAVIPFFFIRASMLTQSLGSSISKECFSSHLHCLDLAGNTILTRNQVYFRGNIKCTISTK
jgi:hypothetical protein